MTIFKPSKQDKHIQWLLKKSRQSFNFDQKGIKNRLMSEIQEQHMSNTAEKVIKITHQSFFLRYKWSLSLTAVMLLIAGTATAFVQADISKPGDTLYALDQWQESIMLKLPLPSQQKAKLEANIITERNEELDYLLNLQGKDELKTQELKTKAVNQSVENLDRAYENVRAAQNNWTSKGKPDKAEKLGKVLDDIDKLADDQAKKIQNLADKETDANRKQQFKDKLEEIRKFRENINK